MILYRDWAPTGWDIKGLPFGDPETQSTWLVAPVCRVRDSDSVTRANWREMVRQLHEAAGNEEEWSVLSFNHWACGWFDIVLVKPGTQAQVLCEVLEERLSQYPVLNEDYLYQEEEND